MGRLITVVGNSGVGKTTFARTLCEVGHFTSLLETTEDRPFLQCFKADRRAFALHNQIDFLLLQAEQAIHVRDNDIVGIQDGGLDASFNVFTKRFLQKGYLGEDEFQLCERMYLALRGCLPLPDLIIHLTAPHSVVAERMARRNRAIDIEQSEDLIELEKLIDVWLAETTPAPLRYGYDSRSFESRAAYRVAAALFAGSRALTG